jgi:hypothetical protein
MRKGQRFNKGDVLFIMDCKHGTQEIVAPFDGKVAETDIHDNHIAYTIKTTTPHDADDFQTKAQKEFMKGSGRKLYAGFLSDRIEKFQSDTVEIIRRGYQNTIDSCKEKTAEIDSKITDYENELYTLERRQEHIHHNYCEIHSFPSWLRSIRKTAFWFLILTGLNIFNNEIDLGQRILLISLGIGYYMLGCKILQAFRKKIPNRVQTALKSCPEYVNNAEKIVGLRSNIESAQHDLVNNEQELRKAEDLNDLSDNAIFKTYLKKHKPKITFVGHTYTYNNALNLIKAWSKETRHAEFA